MIRSGDIIKNPISRETLKFIRTAADSRGEFFTFKTTMKPGGISASAQIPHYHPKQSEKFIILKGELLVNINGEESIYKKGESILIPAGTIHTSRNARPEKPIEFITEFSPALQWDTIIETLFAIAQNGKTKKDGSASLLQMAVTLHKYPDHFILARPPHIFQKILFSLLSPLGKLFGYRPEYEYVKTKNKKSKL